MNYELILGDELILTVETNHPEESPKVIAGTPSLPKVKFSEEAYQQMKERFGWVDVEREGDNFALDKLDVRESYHDLNYGFQEGFKLCQSLNKNMFSEEDLESAFNAAQETINHHGDLKYLCFSDYKKDLRQPKRVKVEVDTEEYLTNGWVPSYSNPDNSNFDEPAEIDERPKISNNTIKITRL